MNADAIFHMGKPHTVCQDYARAGKTQDGRVYALLSDGCSSSPDTDIGARLLVLAAEHDISPPNRWALDPTVIELADRYLTMGGLKRNCLDATIISLVQQGMARLDVTASIAGDGVIAAIQHDGKLRVWDIAFPSGAPGYLTYFLDLDRQAVYKNGHGKRILTETIDGEMGTVIEDSVFNENGWIREFCFVTEQFRAIFAFTDGVHSFQREIGTGLEPVPMLEVVKQLTAIKGFAGNFMGRRAHAFLNKFCRDNKWQHNDDLGCIAIDMGARG